MLADLGAEFPNAVTVLSTPSEVRFVMMETNWMVMVAIAVANVNAETEGLTQEKFATMDLATATADLPAADSTANCQDVVTVLPILVRNATMVLQTLLAPTLADPIALFPNAVMVLSIICMASFATKEEETP